MMMKRWGCGGGMLFTVGCGLALALGGAVVVGNLLAHRATRRWADPAGVGPAPHFWRIGQPVVGEETIVGRAVSQDRSFLLTEHAVLVRVDPVAATVERVHLTGLSAGETVWGLARLHQGTLWTLIGRGHLAELSDRGTLIRKLPLRTPHIGLFGLNNVLVYQEIAAESPSSPLTGGPAGDEVRKPFGSLRTQASTISRVDGWLRNLVQCGSGDGDALPCWFWHDCVIDVIHADGRGTPITPSGLAIPDPRPSDVPAELLDRPIRDAWISGGNELWILTAVSTTPNEGRPTWRVTRHDADGRLRDGATLPAPARLILRVVETRCYLLMNDGGIGVVTVS